MSEVAEKIIQDRLRKVESILVTQARPTDEKSPYFEMAKKYFINIDNRRLDLWEHDWFHNKYNLLSAYYS